MVNHRKNSGLVSYLVFLVVIVAVAYFAMSSRPMDEDGFEYWTGVVRYKVSAGETGSMDLPPGQGVYEVQLQTGLIVSAYTMRESGHRLGDCVVVREQRKPLDARPKYRIEGDSDRCP